MRDRYNRITPNFEAWEKLGWVCEEIHEQTYTLGKTNDSYYDFEQIVFEFDETSNDSPKVWKERISIDGCKVLDFTKEEQIQVDKDIKNFYEEILNNKGEFK